MAALFDAITALEHLRDLQRDGLFVDSHEAQHERAEMFGLALLNMNRGDRLTTHLRLDALSNVVNAYCDEGNLGLAVDSDPAVGADIKKLARKLAGYTISSAERAKMNARNLKATENRRKGKVKATSGVVPDGALLKELEEAKRVAEEAKRDAEEAKRDTEEAKRVAEEANKVAEKAKVTEFYRYQWDRRVLKQKADAAEQAMKEERARADNCDFLRSNAAINFANAKVAHAVAAKEASEELTKAESQIKELMEKQPMKEELMLALLSAEAPVDYRASRANSRTHLSKTALGLNLAEYTRHLELLRAARTLLDKDRANILKAIAKKPKTNEMTRLQGSIDKVQYDIEGNIAAVKTNSLWVAHYTRELHLCSKK